MATSLPVDPQTYFHPDTHTFRNVRYGPHFHHRLNVYRNVTRLAGGNPVLVYIHGGGWGSNDKTSTQESTAQKQRLLWAYLLNSTVYGTNAPPIDLVSIEWRQHALANVSPTPLSTPYEPTIEGTHPGTGPVSFPAYYPSFIDDAQRAVQWCRDNHSRFGFDPDRVAYWGTSAGAANALVAAFAPTRRFVPPTLATGRFDTFSTSKVRGVLNWYGEINFDPWYMHFSILSPVFGLVESSSANVRGDMERLLLVPASDGTFPSGSLPTPLCKSISAVHHLRDLNPENASLQIRSYYWIGDDTTSPQATYSTVPPYLATGHDYHQFADLAAECLAAGVAHSGRVLNQADYGGDVQIMWESSAVEAYDWLTDLMV